MRRRSLPTRVTALLVGLVVMGVAIAAMKQAELGLGPWDVLHDGIARHTGLDLGLVGELLGIPVLLLWWPLRERPGVGTLLNVLVVGLVIHVVLDHTSTAHAPWLRVGLLVGGVAVFALGQGLYLAPELGAGPRDGVMTGLHHRFGWSIRRARTVIELTVLGFGVALGGSAGAGTVLFALGIGPLVQLSLGWLGYPTSRAPELGEGPVDAVGLAGE